MSTLTTEQRRLLSGLILSACDVSEGSDEIKPPRGFTLDQILGLLKALQQDGRASSEPYGEDVGALGCWIRNHTPTDYTGEPCRNALSVLERWRKQDSPEPRPIRRTDCVRIMVVPPNGPSRSEVITVHALLSGSAPHDSITEIWTLEDWRAKQEREAAARLTGAPAPSAVTNAARTVHERCDGMSPDLARCIAPGEYTLTEAELCERATAYRLHSTILNVIEQLLTGADPIVRTPFAHDCSPEHAEHVEATVKHVLAGLRSAVDALGAKHTPETPAP